MNITVTYTANSEDSFRKAVLVGLFMNDGIVEDLPKELREKLDTQTINQLRGELGVKVGKINQNLQNGNKR